MNVADGYKDTRSPMYSTIPPSSNIISNVISNGAKGIGRFTLKAYMWELLISTAKRRKKQSESDSR